MLAEKRRPAGGSKVLGVQPGTRHHDSARQSCTDEAQAAVLAELNEGVRGFHAFNPNLGGEGWQAVEKN
ncbi:PAC domain-containing protein [Pseudomonas sp. IT-P4]